MITLAIDGSLMGLIRQNNHVQMSADFFPVRAIALHALLSDSAPAVYLPLLKKRFAPAPLRSIGARVSTATIFLPNRLRAQYPHCGTDWGY